MRRFLLASSLLCALLVPASALADPGAEELPAGFVTLKYTLAGFAMELRAEGAPVCQVLPEGLEDAGACDGIDVAAARERLRGATAQLVGVSFVGFGAWSAVVTAAVEPMRRTFETASDRDAFIEGMKKEMPGVRPHGDTPGSEYSVVTVGGRTAIKTIVEIPAGNQGQLSAGVVYAFLGNGTEVSVQFVGPVDRLAELERFAAATIATTRIDMPAWHASAPESTASTLEVAVAMAAPFVLLALGILGSTLLFGPRKGQQGR